MLKTSTDLSNLNLNLNHQRQPNSMENDSKFLAKYLTALERQILEQNLVEDLPQTYRQRIEIMLLADEGKKQAEIIQILGCCQDTARRWMLMARTGMALNWRENPVGRPKKVDAQYQARLKELATHSPTEFGYSFRRWTANWLKKHLAKELNIEVSDRHVNHLLKKMGLSTKLNENLTSTSVENQRLKIYDL